MGRPRKSKLMPIGYETNRFSSMANMEALKELLSPPPEIYWPKQYTAVRKELRRLVESWLASGPNLYKFFDQNQELRAKALHGLAYLTLTSTGKADIYFDAGSAKIDRRRPTDLALIYFIRLITNPEWELLGKCPRCGKYFLKRTKKQKVYCSQTCGTRTTAALVMRGKRQAEHKEKLSLARESIKRWAELRPKEPWKSWVSSETGYTTKFLTRAVTNLELQAPYQHLSSRRKSG